LTASQASASAAKLPIWSWWWQNRFKGGLISHSHLDHTGGMIISTQVNGILSNNNKKRWFMNRENLQNHIDHVFNEAVWPVIGGPGPDIIIPKGDPVPADGLSATVIPPFPSKFGDKQPYNPYLTDFLNLLHHIPSEVAVNINGATLDLNNYNGEPLMESCPYIVTEFPVNHGHVARSSAFLISYQNAGHMIMFFGDTGPDRLQPAKDPQTPETSHNLKHIWENIAEHRKNHLLSTIIIEVAMDDSTPDRFLFGHFKPSLFIEELVIMNKIFIDKGCTDGIEGMNFVIIHIKGSDKVKEGKEIRSVIMEQMKFHHAKKVEEEVLPEEVNFHYPTKFEHIRIQATGDLLILRKGISNNLGSWSYGPESVDRVEADVATTMNENLDFYCGFIFGMMFITIIFIFYRTCKRRFHTDFYEPFGPEYEI